MKSKNAFLLLFMLISLCLNVSAQSGANDPSFNPMDQGFGIGDGPNHDVHSMAVQNDGKIIIGGCFTSYNETSRNCIARLNSNGYIDTTFYSGTGIEGNSTGTINTSVNSIAIQNDGKIILGGDYLTYNGVPRNNITRLKTDGSLDTAFIVGSGANNVIFGVAIQSNGKILIVGSFTTYNGAARNRIARLNNDGSLDTTFNSATGANGVVNAVVVQSDGKILIGGDFTTYNGITKNRIARLNTDGSIDETFNIGTGFASAVNTLAIQSDGKIIVGGVFWYFNGVYTNALGIARLNNDGTRDLSFSPHNYGIGTVIRSFSIQSDGKIIMAGAFGTSDNWITRMNQDGSNDLTFSVENNVATNHIYTTAILSDGKILIGGEFNNPHQSKKKYFCRLTPDGAIDQTFNVGTGANGCVYSTVVQSNGRIVIGGLFPNYNGSSVSRMALLNTNGSIAFGAGLIDGNIWSTATQNDGKIIIADLVKYNGTAINRICRLNVDGSIDPTFNVGTQSNGSVNCISLQVDGKIIIGGEFTSFNGITKNHIARLNTNGSIDTAFYAAVDGKVSLISIQSDQRIIIGGEFSQHSLRLLTDGTIDTTYRPSFSNNPYNSLSDVHSIVIQADGKIIMGGDFFMSGNKRIVRLNTFGKIDSTFNTGSGANAAINSIGLQQDGKVIIGGDFTTFNGVAINHIVRLNVNGTIDTTFNVGIGANATIQSISMQSDKKIIIGGDFTSYNGIGRNRVARIINDYLSFMVQPTNKQLCLLDIDSTNFSVVSSGSGVNYQWQVSTDGGATYTDIILAGNNPTYSGYNSNILKLTNIVQSNNGYVYKCIASNGSFQSVNSNPATLFCNFTVPSQPSYITGSSTQCFGNTGIAYSVTNVPGTTYTWTVPIGWTITSGQGTNRITATAGSASGIISVVPSNGCGEGDIRILAATTYSVPAQAPRIHGDTLVCHGITSLTYSVDSIANATSYSWSVPLTWTIASGQGTKSITVTSNNNSSGVIEVTPRNSCGYGTLKTLSVSRISSVPNISSVPSGNTSVCAHTGNYTYSVPNINNTSFNWTIPEDWAIDSGQGTNSITVSIGSTSGLISVTPTNVCGNGNPSVKYVNVYSLPETPNAISGLENVCQGQNAVTYTMTANTYADSYIWTLPNGATGSSSSNTISIDYGTSAVSGNITLKGHNICGDSQASTLAITVNPIVTSNTNKTICSSLLPYLWNGLTFDTAGTQTSTLMSSTGCDSLATLNLFVNPTSNLTTNIVICSEELPYIWNGLTFTTAGSQSVTFISAVGCDSTITLNLTIDSVDVSITQQSNILTANATPATYQWLDCNNENTPIYGATAQSYTATANGKYAVIVTQGLCSDTSACIQIEGVGIALENLQSINLYPNPVSNELIIEVKGNKELFNFEILNTIGQIVSKGSFEEKITIQTSNFTSGFYLVKLENGNAFEFKKIIKE